MKRLIIIINGFLFANAINAQQPQPIFASNPFPKTITVSGSAEMEIIPDEIYVNIELKEYQKKGDAKKDIETIKSEFLQSCKTVGIADSAISIASYNGFNTYYWFRKKKKDPNLNSGITYQVKFRNSDLMDRLVEKLDDDATQSFLIVATSHSKISEYRRQLKILAVKAAKEKGIYLADAIGEKVGETVTIKEPGEASDFLYLQGRVSGLSNTFYNKALYEQDNLSPKIQEVDFKKIKLRFEVEVVFALK
jgi:uncharacterized protein